MMKKIISLKIWMPPSSSVMFRYNVLTGSLRSIFRVMGKLKKFGLDRYLLRIASYPKRHRIFWKNIKKMLILWTLMWDSLRKTVLKRLVKLTEVSFLKETLEFLYVKINRMISKVQFLLETYLTRLKTKIYGMPLIELGK